MTRGLRRRRQAGHGRPRRLPGPVRGDRHGPAGRRRTGLFLRRRRDVRHGTAAGRGRSASPGPTRTRSADLMSRLLGRPTPDPPLEIDANLRPEGKNGPLVRPGVVLPGLLGAVPRSPGNGRRCCGPGRSPATRNSARRSSAAADDFRYPEGGLSMRDVVEIRRIKARVDAERLPRGADPTTHTKLGRGGLADVEWTVQLLQLQHACRGAGPADAGHPAGDRGRGEGRPDQRGRRRGADQRLAGGGHGPGTRSCWSAASPTTRSRARAGSWPRSPRALGYPAGGDPGEFVDDYRRATRRARKVVDRIFDGG